jgi:hypothetical protein
VVRDVNTMVGDEDYARFSVFVGRLNEVTTRKTKKGRLVDAVRET